eukprot:747580-Hanusia_phi.AAC.2
MKHLTASLQTLTGRNAGLLKTLIHRVGRADPSETKSLQSNQWKETFQEVQQDCLSDLIERLECKTHVLAANASDINLSWNFIVEFSSSNHNEDFCIEIWERLLMTTLNSMENVDNSDNDVNHLLFIWTLKRLCWFTTSAQIPKVCKKSKLLRRWIAINMETEDEIGKDEEYAFLRNNPDQETLLLLLLLFISHNLFFWIAILTDIPRLSEYVLFKCRPDLAVEIFATRGAREPKDFVDLLQKFWDPKASNDEERELSGSAVIDRDTLLCDEIIASGTFFLVGPPISLEDAQNNISRLPETLTCMRVNDGTEGDARDLQLHYPENLDKLIHFTTQDGFIRACHSFFNSMPAAEAGETLVRDVGESEERRLLYAETAGSLFWSFALKAFSDCNGQMIKSHDEFLADVRGIFSAAGAEGPESRAVCHSLLYILNECSLEDTRRCIAKLEVTMSFGLALSHEAACDKLSKFAELVAEQELSGVEHAYEDLVGRGTELIGSNTRVAHKHIKGCKDLSDDTRGGTRVPVLHLHRSYSVSPCLFVLVAVLALSIRQATTRRHLCDDEYHFLNVGKQSLPDFKLSLWLPYIREWSEKYRPLCYSFLYNRTSV